MLVFTRQENSDEDLLNGALNCNDRDNAQYGVRRIPEFEEPLRENLISKRIVAEDSRSYEEFKERDQSNQRQEMGGCRYNGCKFHPRIHHRSEE